MHATRKAPRSFHYERRVYPKAQSAKAILLAFVHIETRERREIWIPKQYMEPDRRAFNVQIPAWLLAKNGMDDIFAAGGSVWWVADECDATQTGA